MSNNKNSKVQAPKKEANKEEARRSSPRSSRVQVMLDKSLYAQVRVYAQKMDLLPSAVVNLALRDFLIQSRKRYRLVEV